MNLVHNGLRCGGIAVLGTFLLSAEVTAARAAEKARADMTMERSSDALLKLQRQALTNAFARFEPVVSHLATNQNTVKASVERALLLALTDSDISNYVTRFAKARSTLVVPLESVQTEAPAYLRRVAGVNEDVIGGGIHFSRYASNSASFAIPAAMSGVSPHAVVFINSQGTISEMAAQVSFELHRLRLASGNDSAGLSRQEIERRAGDATSKSLRAMREAISGLGGREAQLWRRQLAELAQIYVR